MARDQRVGDYDRWDGHIDEDAWEVERVLKRRRRLGVTEYLVRWAGWDEKYNSWVPEDDISEELLECAATPSYVRIILHIICH